PSRFEPCGLVQMIAQRYGALPVVRPVGGLADTVIGYDRTTTKTATGFSFEPAEPDSLVRCVERALKLLRSSPEAWRTMQLRAMKLHYDPIPWARAYLSVYEEAVAARGRRDRESELLSHLRVEPGAPPLPSHRRIPESFQRDILFLGVQGPRRLWVHWEVQGEHGRAVLNAMTHEQRYQSRWELRMFELDGGHEWSLEVEGLAKNWFIDVEADRSYRAELWMSSEGVAPTHMLSSRTVEAPPEIGS
ncbi:MAG: DUF4912 domain-containing protein, partial [Planctomycetes bacterium]|nr:DUF4912 domain-containing protein [Planctomycetota bacterium]